MVKIGKERVKPKTRKCAGRTGRRGGIFGTGGAPQHYRFPPHRRSRLPQPESHWLFAQAAQPFSSGTASRWAVGVLLAFGAPMRQYFPRGTLCPPKVPLPGATSAASSILSAKDPAFSPSSKEEKE